MNSLTWVDVASLESGKWIAVIVIGLITFAYRFSFVFFAEHIKLPAELKRALRFVPIAALTAIIVPEVLLRNESIDLTLTNSRMLAAIVAVVIAWRTKNVLWTIVIGMGTLWLFQLFLN